LFIITLNAEPSFQIARYIKTKGTKRPMAIPILILGDQLMPYLYIYLGLTQFFDVTEMLWINSAFTPLYVGVIYTETGIRRYLIFIILYTGTTATTSVSKIHVTDIALLVGRRSRLGLYVIYYLCNADNASIESTHIYHNIIILLSRTANTV